MARSSRKTVAETKARLLECLAAHADEHGSTGPLPWRTIGHELGASIPRCRFALRTLESEGLVVREHLFSSDGGQTANAFHLAEKVREIAGPSTERA